MIKLLTRILLLLSTFTLLIPSISMAIDPVYTGWFSNKALEGYDAVGYFKQNKPVKGLEKFTYNYKGADFLFSSSENLEEFKKSPEKYAPQYGGYCAWRMGYDGDTVSGDPQFWKIVDGKLYLNYDKDIQQKWEKDIPGFIKTADKNWREIYGF